MPAKKKETAKKPAKEKAKKPAAKKPTKKAEPAVRITKAVEKPEKKAAETKHGAVFVNREYINAVGRHKRAVAQVRLYKGGKGEVIINDRKYTEYFKTLLLHKFINDPITASGQDNKIDFSIKISGGGTKGQALAARLGIARALIALNPVLKKTLKKPGYLTRDPRKKERKKPGLKGARRAPQWSKR